MPPVMSLAVIGMGKIATDQHLPALRDSDRFAAVAVVDPRMVDVGLPCFPSVEALLADGPPVTAVAICTPPQVRDDIARRALAAGLHVMLEKPPAATVGGAARLLDACPAGVTLFAAWHSREAPMVLPAAAWLATRTIQRGTMRWREDARRWHPGQQWLWQPGGLGVFDPAINGLSILTAITRQRFSVVEAAFEVPANQHAPIAVQVRLACDTGTIDLNLDFREGGDPCWEMTIETQDGGRLHLSEGGRTLRLDDAPPASAAIAEYPGLYRRFAALIDAGESEVDTAPLSLVADAFLIARITAGEPYAP